jgi:hypothetical protein
MLPLLAANVDDLEKVRIALENRLRQATRDEPDADGQMRGSGLDDRNIYVQMAAKALELCRQSEHQAAQALQRAMRKHPLGPWVKAQRGLGEKQVARLLAAIGDPYIRPPLINAHGHEEPSRPRRVSELWHLCGYHVTATGAAARRQRGQQANWSSDARMRAFLIAESVVKQLKKTCPVDPDTRAATHAPECACSPFRKVYDQGRLKYADAVHQAPCHRCGPKGDPAPAGSPLSAAHQHARALRLVAKEILKELWRESRRLHQLAETE